MVDLRETVFAVLPVVLLVGLFALAAFWISRRARMRELAHRERLAMIEKGLVPPAELFPGGPALAMMDGLRPEGARPSRVATRFRSAGVMFVGVGVALALIIGVTADKPNVGLGIGGAIAAIGAAMIVNAMLTGRESGDQAGSPRQPAPPD